jgi:hypothetical protein
VDPPKKNNGPTTYTIIFRGPTKFKNYFQKTHQIYNSLKMLFNDYRSSDLNMMLKVEFKKIKVGYALIKDTKGYYIRFWSSSNKPIEKSYDGCIVSPVIVAGGLRNLFLLSCCPASTKKTSIFQQSCFWCTKLGVRQIYCAWGPSLLAVFIFSRTIPSQSYFS